MTTVNNEKLTKRNLLILAEAFRRLASVAHLKGASLVSIEDAGALITATTVEGALAELATAIGANLQIQKRELRVQHGDAGFTNAVNGLPDTINLGAALPANAIVVAHEVNIATLFSGTVTAVKLDVGGTTTTAIVKQQDLFTGAASGKTSVNTGDHERGHFSAEQLVLTFTPDAGHKMSQAGAGDVTVDVWFVVLA